MSRFDDELRRATAPLAGEPLPPAVLDEALDEPIRRSRWPAMAALTAVVGVLAVTAGLAVGELTPAPSPSPSATPSPEPTEAAATSCEDVAAPAGGGDVVVVYFPCAPPSLEIASGTRRVAPDSGFVPGIEAALRALLDGPSDLEQQAGMVGPVPAGSSGLLAGVELSENDGLAVVDFDPGLAEINNLSTSAAGGAFMRSMQATVLGFEEVTGVEFRMGGSCDAFFEFFGSTCHHVAEPVEAVSDCPIIPPAELPSGAPITEPRPYPGAPMVSWGSGEDRVTQAPGHRDSGQLREDGTPVTVRGYPGFVRPSGDFPRPLPYEIAWVEEGCPYSVFVALSGGEEAVVDYAARFGPSMVQPPPPPAEPISASVEEDGIRLTVTLDRDRTVFGERMFATMTIENIGSDTIFWGHSGSCVYPGSVQARPDEPARLEYGRDDWPGDAGILKLVTVDERLAGTDLSYGFAPETWLDSDLNLACTSDLQISEIAAGETLVQRRGWDTIWYYDMPPPPGSYTVDAAFHYMSRGAPPPQEAGTDAFSVGLELPITVEGPEIDYVTPGEAVDALLSDESFRDLLADAPRGLWVQQEIAYVDGMWEFALYLTESDREVDPTGAILATVDARSGVVLDAKRDDTARPPGG